LYLELCQSLKALRLRYISSSLGRLGIASSDIWETSAIKNMRLKLFTMWWSRRRNY